MSDPVAGLLLAVVGALLALATPRVVAALPEPAPHEPDEQELDDARAADPPKEPWVVLAGLPGLGPKLAVAAAVVGGLVGARVGLSWPLLTWVVVVPVGVALAVIDWRTRLLPTRIIWPAYGVALVAVGVAAAATLDPMVLVGPLLGSLAGFAVYYLLWFISPRSLGFGDVRLSALLGLALAQLGPGELAIGLYAGFLVGGVAGVAMRLTGGLARKQHLPFGPFMLLGALVGVLWGEPLWASIYG